MNSRLGNFAICFSCSSVAIASPLRFVLDCFEFQQTQVFAFFPSTYRTLFRRRSVANFATIHAGALLAPVSSRSVTTASSTPRRLFRYSPSCPVCAGGERDFDPDATSDAVWMALIWRGANDD